MSESKTSHTPILLTLNLLKKFVGGEVCRPA